MGISWEYHGIETITNNDQLPSGYVNSLLLKMVQSK